MNGSLWNHRCADPVAAVRFLPRTVAVEAGAAPIGLDGTAERIDAANRPKHQGYRSISGRTARFAMGTAVSGRTARRVTATAQLHCPADLLVIAPEPRVAEWCAEPIAIGAPGFILCPSVLPRSAVPVVTEAEEAIRRPELGVLSAMAHGETEQGAAIAAAVLPAILKLDDEKARLYYDLMYNSLNEAARREIETMKGYEYQSDFAKKYVAEGRAEGLSEGVIQGLSQGLTEGLAQGRAQEAARNLLSVLRVRGIAVPEGVRERILAETEPERLERWLEKAVVAASVNEILDEPS